MIRSLRRRHFRAALLLAVVVPLLIVLGLAARRPVPVQPLPRELVEPATP